MSLLTSPKWAFASSCVEFVTHLGFPGRTILKPRPDQAKHTATAAEVASDAVAA